MFKIANECFIHRLRIAPKAIITKKKLQKSIHTTQQRGAQCNPHSSNTHEDLCGDVVLAASICARLVIVSHDVMRLLVNASTQQLAVWNIDRTLSGGELPREPSSDSLTERFHHTRFGDVDYGQLKARTLHLAWPSARLG